MQSMITNSPRSEGQLSVTGKGSTLSGILISNQTPRPDCSVNISFAQAFVVVVIMKVSRL